MGIRGPLRRCNHAEAVRYFNRLILDLKKREMGLKHDPITMERLNEADKHIQDIQNCTRPVIVWR